eukprot:CAMPEP_0172599596 /NCGR_PEP_ID=MMETSP1068-20121228/19683_1 /TAXON_ID=35684 /ORGANISM="Pseudopedinella elastica, Strain CCMP716" /LENGTH=478 /DNA_ID=CAMNT_0013399889 /DNA_START=125 /DNA_END=1558 /DNA_ORIENTATION=+
MPTVTQTLSLDSLMNLACSFDSDMCSFSSTSGQYQWIRKSRGTPTSGTGPTADHTTGSGAYAYIESSSPYSPNAGPFLLECSLVSLSTMTFWYHMYGATMGTLGLNTSTDSGNSWKAQWSKTGDQGDSWQQAVVHPTGTNSLTLVRFWGITGSGGGSDMAIDDVVVEITHQPTSAPTLAYAPDQLVRNQNWLEEGIEFGGTINIGATFELFSQVKIEGKTGIRIEGNGHTIDAKRRSRCFDISSSEATFKDLTITGGYLACDCNGAGILITSSSKVTLLSCVVSSNQAGANVFFGWEGNGGGIFVSSSYLMLRQTPVISNKVEYRNSGSARGGGLYVTGATSVVDLIAGSFSGNMAMSNGRDIYVAQGKVSAYSACPADMFDDSGATAGTFLDCAGTGCPLNTPSDLSSQLTCNACPTGEHACCGSIVCSVSGATCSSLQEATCPTFPPTSAPTWGPSKLPTMASRPTAAPTPEPTAV